MNIKANIELGEFIRSGVRVILKPLVHLLNSRLEEKFGENWVQIACFIYENSDSSNRSLKVQDNRIHWDLYNLTTFMSYSHKKQKINEDGDTIDFRKFLFPELRDDIFLQLQVLRAIRNILSHPVYDGEKEIGYVQAHDVETYLKVMEFLLNHLPSSDECKKSLKDIQNSFHSNIEIIVAEPVRNFIEKIQHDFYHEDNIAEINFSTINRLEDVKVIKIVDERVSKQLKKEYTKDYLRLFFEGTLETRDITQFGELNGNTGWNYLKQKSQNLIGKHVVTTSWDDYDPQKCFNEIYEISFDKYDNQQCVVNYNKEKMEIKTLIKKSKEETTKLWQDTIESLNNFSKDK